MSDSAITGSRRSPMASRTAWHRAIWLTMLLASICLLPARAGAQWVQLSNLTHPGISPSFIAGDQFQLIVAGLPNQPVSVLQTTNGVTGDPYTVGNTDGNGYFVVTGVQDGSNVGS